MINESVESLLYNYKYILGRILELKDTMRGSFESDFGVERKTAYPVEYLQLAEECKKYEGILEELRQEIVRVSNVPSVELAEYYANFLSKQENEQYRVFNKKVNGLTYLCVAKKSDVKDAKKTDTSGTEYVIDVGTDITKNSTRNLFADYKKVGNEIIPIEVFLPEEYKDVFEYKAPAEYPTGPSYN